MPPSTVVHAPLPEGLSAETFQRLLTVCERRAYGRKEDVFRAGDANGMLFCVLSGRLQLTMGPPDQRQWVLGTVGPGEFVGEAGVFLPGLGNHETLRTLEPCRLAAIDGVRLIGLLRTDMALQAPEILTALGAQMARRKLAAAKRAGQMALMDVSSRVWCALEDMARHGDALSHPRGSQVKVSRCDLAKAVGCSREMAGRAVRQFVAQGRMEAHGKTMVLFGPAERLG